MAIVDRYLFKTTLGAFLVALFALTGVIWITQSLREFDLMTTKGQTLLLFLSVTGLTIPSLVMIIAPIALFLAVLYALTKLNGDSELVVMAAAGMSVGRLLRPFAVLIVFVALIVAVMSLGVMPWSFYQLRNILAAMRTDFLTRIVEPGQFTTLDQGFVFHYRERGPNGALLGIFMQDRRDIAHVTTYIAEAGGTTQADGENFLVLNKGSIQRESVNDRDPIIVVFDRYAIDLSQFDAAIDGSPLKPRERSTADLLTLDTSDPYIHDNIGRFRSELSDRIVNPLYALVLGLAGFAALGRPRTTRQSRGLAIVYAVVAVVALRIAGFGASALLNRSGAAIWLVYGLPVLGFAVAMAATFMTDWSRLFQRTPGNPALKPAASG